MSHLHGYCNSKTARQAYAAWAAAEYESGLALQAWHAAPSAATADAFAAYVVALDREEEAAKLLADAVERDPAGVFGARAAMHG